MSKDLTESPARAAVRDVFFRQRDSLLATVRRRGGSKVDADDVLQRAAIRALECADQLRHPERAEAWVSRIIRNVLIDDLRKRRKQLLPMNEEFSATADATVDCWCVLAQTDQLKPDYAAVIRGVVIDGTPISTVAAQLGLTPNNVTVRLHRAKRALTERLRVHCGTTHPQSCSDCGCVERGCCVRPEWCP